MDNVKYINMKAWEAARCKKRIVSIVSGKEMTFLCLEEKKHEGKCKGAIALYKDKKA